MPALHADLSVERLDGNQTAGQYGGNNPEDGKGELKEPVKCIETLAVMSKKPVHLGSRIFRLGFLQTGKPGSTGRILCTVYLD